MRLEAARHVARLGASKVVFAIRTIAQGAEAAKDIIDSCGIPVSRIEVWQLDMTDVHSIETFAQRAQGLDRLDAAILNDGIVTNNFATGDRVESTIAVNFIGSILLALLLVPKTRNDIAARGQKRRLTIVGSDVMYGANLSELEISGEILENIKDEGHYHAPAL